MNSWSVHKSYEFLDWIRSEHTNVLVLFVPTNCTSKLQPADVILQRPLKHAFKLQFHKWTTSQVITQIEGGIKGDVDLRMSNLMPLICEWLHNAWTQVKNMQDMIIKGWDKCGIDKAFIHEFELKAMVANVESPLFKVTSNIEENIEEDNISDSTIPLNNIVSECLIVDVDETSINN
jgi:hypothetical protein